MTSNTIQRIKEFRSNTGCSLWLSKLLVEAGLDGPGVEAALGQLKQDAVSDYVCGQDAPRPQPTAPPVVKTLRDEFAMAALTGLITTHPDADCGPEGYVRDAWYIAELMMERRRVGEGHYE